MDVTAMRASFAKAAATGDEAPLWFYSHLFLSHPETRKLFPVSMAHQRDRLFRALGDIVSHVDDLDAVTPMLRQLGRDHRKFGTVAEHYPSVCASLMATLAHFDDGWNADLAADWAAAYERVAKVMIAAADEAAEEPPWWEADVVEHVRRTFDVAVLRIRPRQEFAYEAGQSVSLETDLRPRLWRYFSPANAPSDDGIIELHIKARDGGPVSSALVRQVGVGDVLRLGPPMGHFTLDEESERDLLLVAGGLGLAPLKALLDQVVRHGPARRVDLFVGVRVEDQLYDRADLDRLAQENPWLTLTYVVSDDKESAFEHGDVGDVVARHGPWNNRDVYVAGPPPMIDDTVARLTAQGVRTARIHTEVFAPSRPGPDVEGEVTE